MADLLTDDGLDKEIDNALSNPDDNIDPDELGIDGDDGDNDDSGDLEAGAGGGDIDDYEEENTGQAVDFAEQRQKRQEEAKRVKDAWNAEKDKRQTAFTDAQAKLKTVRADIDADEDATLAAEQAVMDARFELNKANDGFSTANRYYEEELARPEIAPAAQAWLSANKRYGNDKQFTDAAAKVMAKLKADGMDETHQNFYRKVDEQLRRTPAMGRQSSRRGSAATVSRTGKDRNRGTRSSPSDLSATENKFIRRIGLDPAKKTVQQEWNRNKQQVRRMVRERNGG